MRSKGEDQCEITALGEKDMEDSSGKQEFIGSQLRRNLCSALSSRSEVFTYMWSLFVRVALSQATQESGVSLV